MEILATEPICLTFAAPTKMSEYARRDKSKFCEFHDDYRHEIDRCKSFIEKSDRESKERQLPATIKSKMRAPTTIFSGFSSESAWPLRCIELEELVDDDDSTGTRVVPVKFCVVLYKPEVLGRLAKWLGEHEINYSFRTAVKVQILADYLAETTGEVEMEHVDPKAPALDWSSENLMERSIPMHSDSRFYDHNESEYEALLSGMCIAQKLGMKLLDAYMDSQLVSNNVNGSFGAHESSMQRYIELVHELANEFDVFRLTQVPRGQNKKADALRKLAALAFDHLRKNV
ncbi:uncharacterized protein [Rutidosis leptorrhynchoides]|uniref:uncharacterized protein n=1 Tax=Rutidosis leptorrhynchoides TaxID=125765 RepID=UPI003A98DB72